MAADKPTPYSQWFYQPGNRDRAVDVLWGNGRGCWKNIVYGKDRRNKILALMKEGMQIPVNRSHQIPLNKDPDLLRLLKQGKIVRTKMQHCSVSYTVLVYNHELGSTS